MEFFRTINNKTDENSIKNTLPINQLELMTSQLFLIEPLTENLAKIGSLWGEFTLARQEIKGGLRFSLLECPNALTWTITAGYDPAPDSIVVHLTINRTQKDQEFLEEIQEFLDDHTSFLKQVFDLKEGHRLLQTK